MSGRYVLNQFFYDFKRALRSKTMIIITLIIILLGSSVIAFISSPTPILSMQNFVYAIYGKDSNYVLFGYGFNAFGDPIAGLNVKVELLKENPIFNRNATVLFSQESSTNSSGYLSMAFPKISEAKYIRIQYGQGSILASISFSLDILTKTGAGVYISSPINRIVDSSNSSRSSLLIFYVEENGTRPTGIDVYASPNGDFIKLGTLNDYVKIFRLDPKKFNGPLATVELRKDNNILRQGIIDLEISQSEVNAIDIANAAIAGILVLLIPLLVILASYNLYGKDKIGGVLDFILSLPITRTMLGLSRYLSILLMTFVAIMLSLGFADLLLYIKLGQGLTFDFWLNSTIGLLVSSAALLGLSMIFSSILKSTGSLLAVSIVIWIIFGMFWNTILIAISFALGIEPFSKDFISILIRSYFINPISYYSLLAIYMNNRFVTFGTFGTPIIPAEFGITLINLIIAGLAWTLIPFVIYFLLLKKKD